MKKIVLAVLVIADFLLASSSVVRAQVRSEVTLGSTGMIAGKNDPECGNEHEIRASDVKLAAGAAVIDRLVGHPVATGVLRGLPASGRERIKVVFGIHDGKSICATRCIAVQPKTPVVACVARQFGEQPAGIHASDGSGRFCYNEGYPDHAPTSGPNNAAVDASIKTFDIEYTAKGKLVCATFANWSRDQPRKFWIESR